MINIMQKAEIEEFEKNAKALHAQFPELFSESMEMDFQTTLKGIRKYKNLLKYIQVCFSKHCGKYWSVPLSLDYNSMWVSLAQY